jgi:hypothetical protein
MGPIDGDIFAFFARLAHVVVVEDAAHSHRIGRAATGELAVPALALGVPSGNVARLVISIPEHASIGRQTEKNKDISLHAFEIPGEAKLRLKRHLAFDHIRHRLDRHHIRHISRSCH